MISATGVAQRSVSLPGQSGNSKSPAESQGSVCSLSTRPVLGFESCSALAAADLTCQTSMDIMSGHCLATCMPHDAKFEAYCCEFQLMSPMYQNMQLLSFLSGVTLQEEQKAYQACKIVAINWTQLSQCEHATAQGWYVPKYLCSLLCDRKNSTQDTAGKHRTDI